MCSACYDNKSYPNPRQMLLKLTIARACCMVHHVALLMVWLGCMTHKKDQFTTAGQFPACHLMSLCLTYVSFCVTYVSLMCHLCFSLRHLCFSLRHSVSLNCHSMSLFCQLFVTLCHVCVTLCHYVLPHAAAAVQLITVPTPEVTWCRCVAFSVAACVKHTKFVWNLYFEYNDVGICCAHFCIGPHVVHAQSLHMCTNTHTPAKTMACMT